MNEPHKADGWRRLKYTWHPFSTFCLQGWLVKVKASRAVEMVWEKAEVERALACTHCVRTEQPLNPPLCRPWNTDSFSWAVQQWRRDRVPRAVHSSGPGLYSGHALLEGECASPLYCLSTQLLSSQSFCSWAPEKKANLVDLPVLSFAGRVDFMKFLARIFKRFWQLPLLYI